MGHKRFILLVKGSFGGSGGNSAAEGYSVCVTVKADNGWNGGSLSALKIEPGVKNCVVGHLEAGAYQYLS